MVTLFIEPSELNIFTSAGPQEPLLRYFKQRKLRESSDERYTVCLAI